MNIRDIARVSKNTKHDIVVYKDGQSWEYTHFDDITKDPYQIIVKPLPEKTVLELCDIIQDRYYSTASSRIIAEIMELAELDDKNKKLAQTVITNDNDKHWQYAFNRRILERIKNDIYTTE